MLRPRPELEPLSEVVHGGPDVAELERKGLAAETILDFSSNVCPFGPSLKVLDALRKVPLSQYPDRGCTRLRAVLSRRLGVAADRILCGNGSSELLHLVASAWLRTGDRVLILGPTYGEYARTSQLMGAQIETCLASATEDFRHDEQHVEAKLRAGAYRACFVCTPNNPTGQMLNAARLLDWARSETETLLVVDEAYLDFVPGGTSLAVCDLPNLIVIRSLTKAYGLAAVRLGYLVAHLEVVAVLKRLRPPWNVSGFAQAAGVAAVEDETTLQGWLQQLAHGKEQLIDGLTNLRIECVPSETPFFLADVNGAGLGSGKTVRDALLNQGILVRDCASFGLPDFVRISPRSIEDNERLIQAMRIR